MSIVRETEAHFESGASPKEIMRRAGNTQKVVLSAVYARALRRVNTPLSRIAELVKGTEAKSVKRLNIITRILGVCEVPCLLSR